MENENDKNSTFFRFEDLRIYHKALNYAKWVNEATSVAQINDQSHKLSDRFNNSAYNIALNIAEGSARNKSQFIYYLKMAKSAVRECLVFASIFHNLGLLSNDDELKSRNQLMEMTKMIGALISSLQRNNNNHNNRNDDDDDNDSYHPGNDDLDD